MAAKQPTGLGQLLHILLQGDSKLKSYYYNVYFSNDFLNNIKKLTEAPQFRDKILPGIKNFCREVTEFKSPLKNGYSVEFSPNFVYYPKDKLEPIKYPGLFLILKDSHRAQVGGLRFSIGFPFIIDEVQGTRVSSKMFAINKVGNPQLFFQKNGQHFEVPLIDSFIGLVGRQLDFRTDTLHDPKIKHPKIVFSARAFSDIKDAGLRKRILERYCPSSQRKLVMGVWTLEHKRIMERHFSRLRRK